MKIEKSVNISARLARVYQVFYDFEHWKKSLSDVLDYNLYYDDGFHQEFCMVVARPERDEKIKGMRFCEPNKRIEIFQTIPPPQFKIMSGCWDFFCDENTVLVVARRNFELKNSMLNGLDAESIKKNLAMYLQKNLNCFKNYIEGHYVNYYQ